MDLFSNVSGKRRLKSQSRLHYNSRRNSTVSAISAVSFKEPINEEPIKASRPRSLRAMSLCIPTVVDPVSSQQVASPLVIDPPQALRHKTSFLAKRAAPLMARSYNSMPCIPKWDAWDPAGKDMDYQTPWSNHFFLVFS